jgi:hypothetical protein
MPSSGCRILNLTGARTGLPLSDSPPTALDAAEPPKAEVAVASSRALHLPSLTSCHSAPTTGG